MCQTERFGAMFIKSEVSDGRFDSASGQMARDDGRCLVSVSSDILSRLVSSCSFLSTCKRHVRQRDVLFGSGKALH